MSKLPVVLLHGLSTTGAIWSRVVPGLDRPAEAPDLEPLETVEAVADAVVAHAPDRFHLAGYSFGGYVALALLERHRARVESLTMVASSAVADNDAQRRFRADSIARAEAGGFEALGEEAVRLSLHPDAGEDRLEAGLAQMRASGASRYIAHSRACMARPDRTGLVATTACPLMFVSGDADRIVPLSRQRATAEAAGRPLRIIAGAGHLLPIERPDELAQALNAWLAG